MKKFQRWLEKGKPIRESPSWFGGAAAGWKAALEWMYVLIKGYQDGKYYVADIKRILKRELEDE